MSERWDVMISRIVSPGDRLELNRVVSKDVLSKLKEENNVFAKTLVSQVYDITEENQLKIAMPIVEGKVIPLPINSTYEICFFTAVGLYKSKIIVLDRFKENNIYVIVAELVSELKKFQRRQYFRLEHSMAIEYIVIDSSIVSSLKDEYSLINKMLDENELKKGISIDISGGGIRFASREQLDIDSSVLVKINISTSDGKSVYGIIGKVLNSDKMINNELMFDQRIEYFEIKNEIREIIIRYIFEQERKMRLRN